MLKFSFPLNHESSTCSLNIFWETEKEKEEKKFILILSVKHNHHCHVELFPPQPFILRYILSCGLMLYIILLPDFYKANLTESSRTGHTRRQALLQPRLLL